MIDSSYKDPFPIKDRPDTGGHIQMIGINVFGLLDPDPQVQAESMRFLLEEGLADPRLSPQANHFYIRRMMGEQIPDEEIPAALRREVGGVSAMDDVLRGAIDFEHADPDSPSNIRRAMQTRR